MAKRTCKDCPEGLNRPADKPGPRCATHFREFKKKQKAANHDRAVVNTYGLQAGEYATLYASQNGKCYICQRHNGRTKRLAVDHDHKTGLVRGLLCGPCNQMLGHLRDDIESARRIVEYLERARDRNLLQQ